jgi:hypothetical protein
MNKCTSVDARTAAAIVLGSITSGRTLSTGSSVIRCGFCAEPWTFRAPAASPRFPPVTNPTESRILMTNPYRNPTNTSAAPERLALSVHARYIGAYTLISRTKFAANCSSWNRGLDLGRSHGHIIGKSVQSRDACVKGCVAVHCTARVKSSAINARRIANRLQTESHQCEISATEREEAGWSSGKMYAAAWIGP